MRSLASVRPAGLIVGWWRRRVDVSQVEGPIVSNPLRLHTKYPAARPTCLWPAQLTSEVQLAKGILERPAAPCKEKNARYCVSLRQRLHILSLLSVRTAYRSTV